jgi:hypothetical protein
MTSLKTLILLTGLAALASCAPVANDTCAGWKPVYLAGSTVDYMAAHDPQPLKTMIGNHEFGKAADCW